VDDYVNVSNAPSLNPSTAITLEAWIKRAGIINSGSHDFFISKFITGMNNNEYYLGFYEDKIQLQVSQDGSATLRKFVESNIGISDFDWHHVVGTFDNGIIKIYIDGAGVTDDTPHGNGTSIFSGSANLTIGSAGSSAGYYFNGLIDEVAIYNRALIATEILDHYNNGVAGKGYCIVE